MRQAHSLEVAALKQQIAEMEERYRHDVSQRDHQLHCCHSELQEQGRVFRVGEFLPHASKVTQFLETLPSLDGPNYFGTAIVAPVWALRCVRSSPCTAQGNASTKNGIANAARG